MRLKLKRLLTTSVLFLSAAVVPAQTPDNPPTTPPETPPSTQEPETTPPAVEPAPKPQFFAGTVTEVDHEHVTVSRTLVGKPPETRTFIIKPETKVGRSLRQKLRVTVRYKELPEGNVALEIRIHSQPRSSKSS